MSRERVLLLDGDTLIFTAAQSSEYEIEWNEWLWTLHADLSQAILRLDQSIEEIRDGLKGDRVIIALSSPGRDRWRKQIMPTYKSNRKGRKPVVYQALREYCHEVQETFERPTLEGDDVLGILATHPHLVKGEKIVVAIDKDMQTFPGLHVNYNHAREKGGDYEGQIRAISEEEADRFHLTQALAGDSTDGYPGAPGIGMKTAAKLLDEGMVLVPVEKEITRGPRKGQVEVKWVPGEYAERPWDIVVSAYKSKGLSEEAALVNARVARICRYTDYDFKKKRVRLWTP